MFVMERGCCGSSLRSNTLVVLYVNGVLYALNILSLFNTSANPYYADSHSSVIVWSVIFSLINMLICFIPIAKGPEKSLTCLKAFIGVKIFEIFTNVWLLFEFIRTEYFKKMFDAQIEVAVSEQHLSEIDEQAFRESMQSIGPTVELFAIGFYILLILIFGVYFPVVVYSYLKEVEKRENSPIVCSTQIRGIVVTDVRETRQINSSSPPPYEVYTTTSYLPPKY